MTPEVSLALIALANKLVDQAIPIIGAIGGLVTLLYQVWTRADAKKGRAEIKASVAAVDAKVDALPASGFDPLATQKSRV